MTTHLKTVTKALKFHPDAFQLLLMEVKTKEWLPPYSKPSEEDLVSLIINRIELDANQFEVFIDMLHKTEGMDLVVHFLNSEY